MRKASKYKVVFLIGILLVLGTASLLTVFSDHSVSQQQKVATILNQYIDKGLIVNNILDNKTISISDKDNTFQYIAGATLEDFVSQIESQDLENTKFHEITLIEYIKNISLEFTKATQYKNKVKINEVPSDDSINIFILKKDPEKLVRHFNNCSYIGWMYSILCNIDFLEKETKYIESFDKAYDILMFDQTNGRPIDIFQDGEKKNTEIVKNNIIASFLTWVIGHEIGHAILHHKCAINPDDKVDCSPAKYIKREEEADNFIVSALQEYANQIKKPGQTAAVFWLYLGEYFQHKYRDEISRSLRAKISDQDWNSHQLPLMIKLGVEKKHNENPYLLRILNILCILTERIDNLDETGFYSQGVKPNVYPVPSYFDVALKYVLILLIPIFVIVFFIYPTQKSVNKNGEIK